MTSARMAPETDNRGCAMAVAAAHWRIGCIAAAVATTALAVAASAKQCYAPDARAQARAFSRVVTTEGGRTFYLAGHTSDPAFGFDQQVRDVFSQLDQSIKASGGVGLSDMVTMTVFITDARLGDRFIELRKEVFKECFPASALITIAGLAQPGLLVEIQGIAVVDGK
jgi:2-iminobutanoate/2-iminopropanoate deaminase